MKVLPLGLQSIRGVIMSGTLNIIITLLEHQFMIIISMINKLIMTPELRNAILIHLA